MFTGIVEEIGRIKNIRRGVRSITLDIEASKVLEDVHVGDSICTNGVCLTVTEVSAASSADGLGRFKADVMPETMRMTSLSILHTEVHAQTVSRHGILLGQGIDGSVLRKCAITHGIVSILNRPRDITPYIPDVCTQREATYRFPAGTCIHLMEAS